MADIVVVADDLTGANAAAAGFARDGLRSVTASAATGTGVVEEMVRRFDVVVATTDTRHASPEVARARAAAVVRAGWPARLVCNRIDTTLRGNVGASTEAVQETVASLSGSRVVVLCAPAHPAADRHTVGGKQLLRGHRLEQTEVARDARTPMRTSDIPEILAQQTDLAVTLLPMAAVTDEWEGLVSAIRRAIQDGTEVLVPDALTVDHLDRVASAAVAASEGLDVVWVTSDPGPGSVSMARALGLRPAHEAAPLLVVSGSATELTRGQLRQLANDRPVSVHRTPTVRGSAVPDIEASVALLGRALEDTGPGDTVVLATVLEESDLRSVSAEEAEEIPLALATVVRRSLETHAVDGLFSTGGDVTAALLAELGSQGLEISEEVVPLAVAGSVVGGPWDGLPIVTKGGLVGDSGTTVECVDHLRRQAEAHRRQVSSGEAREHARTPAQPPAQPPSQPPAQPPARPA